MSFIARRAILALLMLSALVLSTAAQDGVRVSGSGVAGLAFSAVVTDETIEYDLSGTQNGLNAFCNNATDIALSNRPISLAEESTCAASGVTFSELLIGYDGYALIASPDVDFASCLSTANLDATIAPSLVGTEVKWNAIDAGYPELAITFVYPGLDSRPAALLDRIVKGEGFRSDALTAADSAAVIADVAAGSGKIGLVSLSDALSAEGVTVLELSNPTLGQCVAPSVETALDRQYVGGDRLFAYINPNSVAKPAVANALAALTSVDAASVLLSAGFVPLTESLRAQASAVVEEGTTGRVFSKEMNVYQITGDTTGTLRVGGTSVGANYLKSALATVTSRYSTITLEESYVGTPGAAREFCNGNREIIAVTGPLNDEEQANCDANSIISTEVHLGAEAAVLVGNSADDFLSCVSTDLIANVFGTSAEPATTWNAADPSYPDLPPYLFVSSKGDTTVDLLMIRATGQSTPVREDVQVSADLLYRANAVANTPGALALMTWGDAQEALAAQDGIRLVSVQSEGGDCVAPSVETIKDGSYPISQQVSLLVNERSLELDMVQATLYTLFGDDNYRQIESAGLIGIAFGDLVDIRASLVLAFREADAAEATRFAEEVAATQTALAPTAEGGGDVTPEPTTEGAAEATATPGQ